MGAPVCAPVITTANVGPLPTLPPSGVHFCPLQIQKSQGSKSSCNKLKNVKYNGEQGIVVLKGQCHFSGARLGIGPFAFWWWPA
jgi:hypothetical protein